jgi:hypothetical protein
VLRHLLYHIIQLEDLLPQLLLDVVQEEEEGVEELRVLDLREGDTKMITIRELEEVQATMIGSLRELELREEEEEDRTHPVRKLAPDRQIGKT